MSLLPESASFEELVQDCFLTHRGAGLMLSPLDVELIVAWAAEEVPFEVVARGIRRAAEKALWDARPGEPVLRSLRACRREVDAEIRKYRSRSVGRSEAPSTPEPNPRVSLEEERHKRLRSALTKLAKENASLQPRIRALLDGPLASPPRDLTEADHREEVTCAALLRALPFEHRLSLYREAAAHSGPSAASAHARKVSRRFHRHALLRRALNLPSFW
ncbi:MAG: hypothetical protein WBV82_28915 [Myxococcaceae bacterium]